MTLVGRVCVSFLSLQNSLPLTSVANKIHSAVIRQKSESGLAGPFPQSHKAAVKLWAAPVASPGAPDALLSSFRLLVMVSLRSLSFAGC